MRVVRITSRRPAWTPPIGLRRRTWNERSEFRQTIERSAFDRISFRAIGEALTSSPSHLPPDAQTRGQDPLPEGFFTAVVADYRKNLDRLAATILQTTDRHIPCNLFDTDQGVQPFAVGPVAFLPRADWIARYVKSTGARDHIRSVESGQLRYADLRDRALATGSDADLRTAWEVLTTLDAFEWVATVRIEGCVSAWNKDPFFGVIGIQSGPRDKGPQWLPSCHGSRGWDAGGGDDW